MNMFVSIACQAWRHDFHYQFTQVSDTLANQVMVLPLEHPRLSKHDPRMQRTQKFRGKYLLGKVGSESLELVPCTVALVIKNPSANAGDIRDADYLLSPPSCQQQTRTVLSGEDKTHIWTEEQQAQLRCRFNTTPVFLPGECHGRRSLTGCGPQGCKEFDTTEVAQHTHMYCHLTA